MSNLFLTKKAMNIMTNNWLRNNETRPEDKIFDKSISRIDFIIDEYINKLSNKEDKLILDCCASDGRKSLQPLIKKTPVRSENIIATDVNKERLELLKSTTNCNGVCFDILNIASYKDKLLNLEKKFNSGFDIILFTEIIEHIDNKDTQLNVLKELFSILKKDGDFILSFPYPAELDHFEYGHKCAFINQPVVRELLERNFHSVKKFIKSDGVQTIYICKGKK